MTTKRSSRFRLLACAMLGIPMLASAQIAMLDAYPDQITFCAAPVVAQAEGAIARQSFAPVTVEVSVSNLASTAPSATRRVKNVDKSAAAMKQFLNGRIAASSDLVHGVGPTVQQPDPSSIFVQAAPELNPRSAFRVTTTCFDRLGNALPLFGGQSCKISVTFEPSPIAASEILQIVTDDPARPVINVPLLVSRAQNCRQPAQRPFAQAARAAAFYPAGPGRVEPEIARATDCRCNVICGSGSKAIGFHGMHVVCYPESLNTCHRCCHRFGEYLCGPADLNFTNGQAWK